MVSSTLFQGGTTREYLRKKILDLSISRPLVRLISEPGKTARGGRYGTAADNSSEAQIDFWGGPCWARDVYPVCGYGRGGGSLARRPRQWLSGGGRIARCDSGLRANCPRPCLGASAVRAGLVSAGAAIVPLAAVPRDLRNGVVQRYVCGQRGAFRKR